MSLSERLAAAAKDRTSANEAEWGLKSPPSAPARELTIILGAHVPVSAVEPDPEADPDAICPTCGRTGELGVVDLHRRTSDWSCDVCGAMWRLVMPPHPSSASR
jgi:hypothetical protein